MNYEEIEKIIKDNNIKLFTKDNFFDYFSKILSELSSNIFKCKSNKILTKKLESQESINFEEDGKSKNVSPWYKVMKIILFSKENNNFNINLLCYNYMLRFSNIIKKKLLAISIKTNTSLSLCIKIYLKLCEEKLVDKNKIIKKKYSQKETKNLLFKRLTTNFTRMSLIRANLKKEEFKNLEIKKSKNKTDYKKQINKTINNEKNNKNNSHFLYCNSFTRLFIGEIDEESVKERYLSNIIVKNEQRLNIHGLYVNLSRGYLKQLYNKIQKQNQIEELISNPENISNRKLVEIQKTFKKDYKLIERLKNNSQKKGQKNIIINNNLTDRNAILQPNSIYPSIIKYNYKNNNKHIYKVTSLNKKKEKRKIIKSLIKNKYEKYKLFKINNSENISNYLNNSNINTIKGKNCIINTFVNNTKYLSKGNSLNNSNSKEKKNIFLNIKDKSEIFKKRLNIKKNFIKQELNFNSFNGNKKICNNFGDKEVFKNFLNKNDFFFEGL